MTPPDEFSTERLTARRVRDGDLDYVVAVDTNPEMAQWLGGLSTRAESEARLQRWLDEERRTGLGFWIFSDGSNPVGHGGLFTSAREPGSVELGYAVLPAYWRHGYATEMALALLQLAREHDIQPLVALTLHENLRSRRVLEKLGLEYTGDIQVDGTAFVRYTP